MRRDVEELVRMGPMPASTEVDEDRVYAYQWFLDGMSTPVTDEEARALLRLFGPDDFFGLAWSLIRLVESAPGWPLWDALEGDDEWIDVLRHRAENLRRLTDSP